MNLSDMRCPKCGGHVSISSFTSWDSDGANPVHGAHASCQVLADVVANRGCGWRGPIRETYADFAAKTFEDLGEDARYAMDILQGGSWYDNREDALRPEHAERHRRLARGLETIAAWLDARKVAK